MFISDDHGVFVEEASKQVEFQAFPSDEDYDDAVFVDDFAGEDFSKGDFTQRRHGGRHPGS